MADRESPSVDMPQARKRWNRAAEAEDAQRKRIVLAKNFRAGEQWPSAIKLARQGGSSLQGQAPQPPRPCLVVDRLSQPVRQVSNTIKNANFGFDVMPAGGGSDADTAEIFKGYLRWMQNNSRGESPIEWAADGAIESGIGWFRLRTDYVNETWDGDLTPEVMWQALFLERITNPLTVYCDPAAVKPTRSDAQWMFITEDISKDEFKRLYPKADIRGLENFIATGDHGKIATWATEDMVRIAEYWRIVYQNRTLSLMPDGSVVEGKQKGAEQTRVMRVPVVKCDKINALESLEQYEWTGSRIPIIPVLGEELNIDGKVWLRGIIEEGMDAQRMVNYTYSGAVEIFALAPKNAPMVAAQSVANYKSIWQTRNTVNHAYLPYDPFGPDGQAYPPPVLDTTEPPIQAAVELMRVSEDAIKATTSTGDASLGNTNPNERSGRALQALQSQSDLANSNYPDNVRRALIYAAELALEVIPKITKPGQIIHILGMDDEPDQVMVGQPFTKGPNGVPQASDVDPEVAKLKETLPKFYDLNNGRYAVTVSVGKATATKREEGAAALGELIQHLPPPMAAVLAPEYIEQLSMPNAHKMAEIARKSLPPELQAASQDDGQQPQIPPQLQAQMQQMQQQLQQAHQIIQTKQVEQQGSLQEAQIKAQSDQQIAQHKADTDADRELALQVMKNAAAIAIAHINASTKGVSVAAHAQEEQQALGHEQTQNAFDRQHDVNMAQLQHGQAMQQGDQSHQQALEQGDQSAQNAQQQQQSDQQHQAEMAQQAQAQAQQKPNGGGA